MPDPIRVIHLLDPLCGWCYGCSAAIRSLAASPVIRVDLAPTGLFAGPNARMIDDSFAAYIWSADQHIAQLTGQRFTERYRRQVLGTARRLVDSTPATAALTAVARTEPARELEALVAIQAARWVDGCDITRDDVLADVLTETGLGEAAALVAAPPADLAQATQARIDAGGSLLRRLGATGVPALAVAKDGAPHLIDGRILFDTPHEELPERIRNA